MTLAVGARAGHDGERPVRVGLCGAELLVEAGRSGHLHVRPDADPQRHPVPGLPAAGLLGAQLVVTGRRHRRVERRGVLAVVVLGARPGGQREPVRRDEVPATQLDRVHPEVVGGDVEDPFEHLGGLGAPGAAVGVHRGRRRGGGTPGELDGRDLVHALGHQLGQARQDGAAHGVGAGVADHRRAQPDEPSVAAHTELGVLDLAAPVGHREHVLRARLGPAHRPTQGPCGPRDQRPLEVRVDLRTETATDVRRHDPHLLGLEAQVPGQRVAHVVRVLAGDPEGDPAVLVPRGVFGAGSVDTAGHRDPGVRLHGDAGHALDDEGLGDHDLGVVEDALDLAGAPAGREVRARLVEQQWRVVAQGLLGAGHRGQRIDVGEHGLGRADRVGRGLGDHHGDDVTDEPDLARGQVRARHRLRDDAGHPLAGGEVDVRGGVDRDDPGETARLLDGHRVQRAVGDGRADEDRVQRALDREVGGVLAGPGDQGLVLGPLDAVAEDRPRLAGRGHRASSWGRVWGWATTSSP